ncbi:MAG: homoserine kinase [SAR202 cluster bacterium]|nr:homoserine kinase [SAR202 cluster bacterium]MDP7104892.1 homoserine kinase [SAR202 cluster bacterium]HJO81535.1 homoserine kinase [SAR202 cluster bacterium]
MKKSVKVQVPATSANMGPGFDCLGMALDIWNTVEVTVGGSGVDISGEGHDSLPKDASNLVHKSVARVFEQLGRDVPEFRLSCHNEIPLARGLGSSSASLIGGLTAGNELCDQAFTEDEILQIASEIEGHPDNVTPALYGGFRIAVNHNGRIISAPVPIPEGLEAVLFIPDVPMPTEEARGILPPEISRTDAVHNIGRAALLVQAFTSGDLSLLDIATGDVLHQPARQAIFPAMKNMFRAAMAVGALGVFLSGAGSTVLALARDKEFTIGYEMADAAAKSGIEGQVKITKPVSQGAQVVHSE